MNILIVNGSPRGRFSVTLQSCLYLEKRFPKQHFEYLNAGAGIGGFEKDMRPAAEAFARAELTVFAYPVYSFLVPSQLHRFLELIRENELPLKDKYVTQFSTSKHFFDVTAHRFLEENFHDLGMRVIRGLSADMEDLLDERGRRELEDFFRYAVFCAENAVYEKPASAPAQERAPYVSVLDACEKQDGFDTVIVGDLREGDESLRALIRDFGAAFPYRTRFVNLAEFPFRGGCLGCLNCAAGGKCVYRDGFDALLREKIQNADAIVYAFTLRDHSMGSRFKMYDDRQFCNGHRTVTMGTPFGYLVEGEYAKEENLRLLLEARAQVGGNYLAGVATDETDADAAVDRLAATLCRAMETRYTPPQNFLGVGGMKIFRDLIYMMRGLMRADHKFFKSHGQYDFPQKQWRTSWKMYLVGWLMNNRKLRAKAGNKMTEGMIGPYRRVLK